MRLLSLTALATLAISFASAAAPPRAAADAISARQAQRKELQAKAQYPDIFKRQFDFESGLPPECNYPRKRGVLHDVRTGDDVHVLGPKEVADFLVDRGVYTARNGTRLVDRSFLDGLEEGEAINAKRSRLVRALNDAVANTLVSIGMPVYRQWKERALNGMDATFHLSETTAFNVRDIPNIERALLDHPEFTETQVLGYRITRRFIEAANALN